MSSFETGPLVSPKPHPLAVLYGSETGTAQEVAEYISGMARRRTFDASAESLDACSLARVFESSLAVFVVSTTGDGEVPSNMSTFWRFLLRRSLPKDCLCNMRFAVFGLGDSGYAKYNATARKLHARLLQLGAVELVDRGLGDDQSPRGMWGDLDPWLATLWPSLLQINPLPKGTVVDDTPRLEPPLFEVTPAVTNDASDTRPVPTLQGDVDAGLEAFWDSMAPPRRKGHGGEAPLRARLIVNRRLTEEGHFQDVRHLEFDVSGVPGGEGYAAGDVAWVHPSNDSSAVETLALSIGLDLDQTVRIAPAVSESAAVCESGYVPGGGGGREGSTETLSLTPNHNPKQQRAPFFLPRVSTFRLLLRDVLDILGTPRRSFFERLSLFAGDREEREKLEELASPAGADLLYEYATREKRSYVEVLGDFPSCKVPPERLLELIPRMRPRGFSIASSALETPSKVHLCMAVVAFRTPYKRLRKGVCSTWLASLTPGAEVPLSIRPGTFKLPPSPSHPLVMVGPGTGVAPMRSVILERRRQRQQQQTVEGCGEGNEAFSPGGGEGGLGDVGAPDTLFFGCRFQDKDFLYKDDWAQLCESGDLSLQTAFSRSNPDGTGARIYVQRRIREQAFLLAGLIVDRDASVLVSGSAKQMPRDVREAFRDALKGHEKVGGEAGAEKLLKTMERQGRYCVEAWS